MTETQTPSVTIELLNGLMQMCSASGAGYRLAAPHLRYTLVRQRYDVLAAERGLFARELEIEINRLGGSHDYGSFPSAGLSAWARIPLALSGKSPVQVHAEVLRCDEEVLRAYSYALEHHLSPVTRHRVHAQCERVREALTFLRAFGPE